MNRLPTPEEHDALLEHWCQAVETLMRRHGHADLSLVTMVQIITAEDSVRMSRGELVLPCNPASVDVCYDGWRWGMSLLDRRAPVLREGNGPAGAGLPMAFTEPTPLHPDFEVHDARWRGLPLALCQSLQPQWLVEQREDQDVGASMQTLPCRGPGSVLEWLLEQDPAHAARWRARRLDGRLEAALVDGEDREHTRL